MTTTTTRADQARHDAHPRPVGAGTDHRPGHTSNGAHPLYAGPVTLHPQANDLTKPNFSAPAGPAMPNPAMPAGQTPTSGQRCDAAHITGAAGGPDLPADHSAYDAHAWPVGGEPDRNGSATANFSSKPTTATPLADPFLRLAADILDDAEENRKANANRLGQLTRTGPDDDGIERGFGLDESHPDVARVAVLVDMLAKIEHQAALNLAARLRKHPLGPWVKAQKGVGDKQAARLLAVVGDPYLNMQTGQPRTVSQLWAYCGHGDPGRRKFKGMGQADLFALGNPTAKMRLWNIAGSCLKAQGHYADVYYARKEQTVGREHAADCIRCGPSGHPALKGSPWSDAHRHADALRIVGKEILRDLWTEAKRLHEEKP